MNNQLLIPLCCVVFGAAAFIAGRQSATVEVAATPAPRETATVPAAAPSQPAPVKIPAALEAPSVLPQIVSLVNAADSEADPIGRQQLLNDAAVCLGQASSAEVRELFLTTTNEVIREWAARRWGEVDPKAMLQHLASLSPRESARLRPPLDTLKRALFQGWAHIDPAAALAAAAAEKGSKEFNDVFLSAAAQAIADDPAKGFSLSAQYRSPWLHFHNWRAFRSMWEHQPAAFTREVFGRTQPSLRDSMTLAAIDSAKAWASADAAGFSAWAVKEFSSDKRELHQELDHARLFEILMEHDPEAAGRVFAEAKPSFLRNKMQALYVSHIAAANPQEAAQWIDDNVTAGRSAAFTAWAEASAKAVGHKQAAVLALSLPPGAGRDAAAGAALDGWADDDVNAAVAWAKAQPASEGENAPVTHMTYAWLKYHASEASRYIMEHPDLGWSPSIFLNATRNLPFAEAVGLIKSLPDQHAETSLKMLSERLANGSNKVREIASLPPERQAIAVRSAAEEIAYTDPKRAATWVAALPAGPLRAAGEEGLAGR